MTKPMEPGQLKEKGNQDFFGVQLTLNTTEPNSCPILVFEWHV